ncbi:hypothetical protein ACOBQJ_11055 [Pelotomaculum propionicicum]
MAADKTKNIPLKKQKRKARNRVVSNQDINTAILRDVKEDLTND